MQELIAKFGNQLQEALKIGEDAKLTPKERSFANVFISGMGGSGIGGRVVAELTSSEAKTPIEVYHDYSVPAYLSDQSLVIISSCSGDTEEALEAFEHALKKGAKVVCIASGGKLIMLAKERGFDHIVFPSGMPPRACIGYSMVQIFYILNFYGIIGDDFKNSIKASISLLEKEEQNIVAEAKKVAQILSGKLVATYAPYGFGAVAVRFRQQLNENAKVLGWVGVLPEMNHNELVGWSKEKQDLAVVFLRNDSDYSRTKKRIDITKEVVSKYTTHVVEIYAKGDSNIEQAMYHIHMGDYISFFLAEQNNIDPEEIEVIKYLKKALAEFKG